jgi:hypothetical protein
MNLKGHILTALSFIWIASIAHAQQKESTVEKPKNHKAFYLGAGFGFDHGGLGLKATFEPIKHLGLFGGVGYNLAGIAGNGGLIFNMLPASKVTTYGHVWLQCCFANKIHRE